jgi:hypothetical protein
MKEELHVYIGKDKKVILETHDGYYHLDPKDAADLGWSFLKLAFKLDKTIVHNALDDHSEPRGTLQ